MIKRLMIIVAMLALAYSMSAQTLKDGKYYAQDSAFASTGWKDQVVLEVKGGKISSVNWNGIGNQGLADKKTVAASGGYGMKKVAKQGEWDVQAKKVEEYLIKVQDPSKITFNDKGKTDAITGASMTVSGFVDLVKQALSAGPVSKGMYAKDGWYYASAADFDSSGWKSNVLATVVNGTVVDVIWNGMSKDTKKKSKLVEAVSGKYGMSKVAKQGEWNVQAEKVHASLLKVQDPTKIAVNDKGKADAITGVSITVADFFALSSEALKNAK